LKLAVSKNPPPIGRGIFYLRIFIISTPAFIKIRGAGDRTRTGTLSPAADFERRGFSGIWGCSEALKGTIHLAKRIKTM